MRQRNDKSSPFQLADRQLGLFEINKIIAFDSIDLATHANQWTADTGSKGRTIWPVDFYWYGNAQLMHIHYTMCGYQSLSNDPFYWCWLLLVYSSAHSINESHTGMAEPFHIDILLYVVQSESCHFAFLHSDRWTGRRMNRRAMITECWSVIKCS